jgi:CBS domain containing-hemolysin-like protein
VGFVHRSAILASVRRGELSRTFGELSRPLGAIPETATCASALTEFLRDGAHIMLAVDEYGGTSGVVALEDVIETILGVEIVGETDPAADMREIARQRSRERLARRLANQATFDDDDSTDGSDRDSSDAPIA